ARHTPLAVHSPLLRSVLDCFPPLLPTFPHCSRGASCAVRHRLYNAARPPSASPQRRLVSTSVSSSSHSDAREIDPPPGH
uniref:Uncharacterized protein n=1 Tax=Oryza brachyantha TaxID=4533 RepID=J3L6H7_ORYBR